MQDISVWLHVGLSQCRLEFKSKESQHLWLFRACTQHLNPESSNTSRLKLCTSPKMMPEDGIAHEPQQQAWILPCIVTPDMRVLNGDADCFCLPRRLLTRALPNRGHESFLPRAGTGLCWPHPLRTSTAKCQLCKLSLLSLPGRRGARRAAGSRSQLTTRRGAAKTDVRLQELQQDPLQKGFLGLND